MHRFKGRVGLCAMVALGVVTACGGSPDPARPAGEKQQEQQAASRSGEASPGEDRAVTWANDYCGAVSELVRSVSEMPIIDASSPRRASETSGELLKVMVGGLDRTLDRLDNLGAPPVDGAERVRRDAVATYADIREHAQAALSELSAAEGPEASRDAVSSVRKPLDDLGGVDLLAGFDTVPALQEASRQAPACRTLTDADPDPRIDSPGS
ncbi:hypothetical protein [Saccharomonospora cyanea]|uniref:Lipoprotein n=1 Tax=Saccharomonospora cyanea NA-134 TaxID=882082 RepID=H5XK86_9PSEU|nr:hypothetical protein [Saccharomonospora cyanea]EHR63521.1 hypothetical protein SaccyDRAFT_4715 [Saccharomonospora cyanea NA-134]